MSEQAKALTEAIAQVVQGECARNWKEYSPAGRAYNVVCGHPLPCPEHTDIAEWKRERVPKIKAAVLKEIGELYLRTMDKDITNFMDDIESLLSPQGNTTKEAENNG